MDEAEKERLYAEYAAGHISGKQLQSTLHVGLETMKRSLAERGIEYRTSRGTKFDMEKFHALAKRVERGEIGNADAAKELGASRQYFMELLDRYGYDWKKTNRKERKFDAEGRGNPCATCGESYCEWLQWHQPVPGWTATPIRRSLGGPVIDGFDIRDCPKYKHMPTAKERRREAIRKRRAW